MRMKMEQRGPIHIYQVHLLSILTSTLSKFGRLFGRFLKFFFKVMMPFSKWLMGI